MDNSERFNQRDMRITILSDRMILCESRQQAFSDYGVWTDSGILTGNLRNTYLRMGNVHVTDHQQPVFQALLREVRKHG